MKSWKILTGLLLVFGVLTLSTQSVSAQEMSVCSSNGGSFKSYMAMTSLGRSTPQYQYLANNTYDESNLRITNDGYYAVAMGSYYGVLGDKFIITFDNGTQTKVVKVDEKANVHTSQACYGMSMEHDGSIIEPIITTHDEGSATAPSVLSTLRHHGNAGMAYAQFAQKSTITSINKVTGSTTSTQELNQQTNTFDDSNDPAGGSQASSDLFLKQQEEEKELDRLEAIRVEEQRALEEIQLEELRIAQEEEEKLMALFLPNAGHDKLVFLDTEFMEGRELVQAAFIIYEKIDDLDHYFLTTSLNVFINTHVTPAFEAYTGIKGGFLGNEGLTKSQAQRLINSFIDDNGINTCNTLVIGHGVKQDLLVLQSAGCDINTPYYDTHVAAKQILNRDTGLKLTDLLLDAGMVESVAHDAYQDARDTVPVYAHLKWVEYKEDEERG